MILNLGFVMIPFMVILLFGIILLNNLFRYMTYSTRMASLLTFLAGCLSGRKFTRFVVMCTIATVRDEVVVRLPRVS